MALVYRQGGTLTLDERFEAQPSSCTITIRTLQDDVLSTISGLSNVEAASATVETLDLTLAATAKGARQITVSTGSGTGVSSLLTPGFRLLIVDTTGRKQWATVNGVTTSAGVPTILYIDEGVDFALAAGAKAYSVRCSYAVDWSAVTSTYVGEVKVKWVATVGGVATTRVKIVDIVKQELAAPAVWADILDLRPDADEQMSRVKDKDRLLRVAWEHLTRQMRNMGVYHNLIVTDGTSGLRDAHVYETLLLLTRHQGLTPPLETTKELYEDDLVRDRDAALFGLRHMAVDADEDEAIADDERDVNYGVMFFRRKRKPYRVTS